MQILGDLQPVNGGRDKVGIGGQKRGIAVGELPRLTAVDLQKAEGGLVVAADDGDVGHRPDAIIDQERRVAESRLFVDVGRNHRLARFEGMTLRGVFRGHGDRFTDDARLPTHACPHQKCLVVLLQFHDLGQISAESLSDEAAGFGQNCVQIIGPEGEFAELCQSGLLPQQLGSLVFSLCANCPRLIRSTSSPA